MTRIVHIKSRDEWLHPEAYAPVDYDRSSLYRTEAETDRIEQLVRLVRKEMWQDRIWTAFKGLIVGLLAVIVPALIVAWWVA